MRRKLSFSYCLLQICPIFHYDVIKSILMTFDDLKDFTKCSYINKEYLSGTSHTKRIPDKNRYFRQPTDID